MRVSQRNCKLKINTQHSSINLVRKLYLWNLPAFECLVSVPYYCNNNNNIPLGTLLFLHDLKERKNNSSCHLASNLFVSNNSEAPCWIKTLNSVFRPAWWIQPILSLHTRNLFKPTSPKRCKSVIPFILTAAEPLCILATFFSILVSHCRWTSWYSVFRVLDCRYRYYSVVFFKEAHFSFSECFLLDDCGL